MKVVNVNLVDSPAKTRLIINDDIVHEADVIPYDVLFQYIQEECKEPVNITFHAEWTADLDQWDADLEDDISFVNLPGESIVTSTDVVDVEVERTDLEEELDESED